MHGAWIYKKIVVGSALVIVVFSFNGVGVGESRVVGCLCLPAAGCYRIIYLPLCVVVVSSIGTLFASFRRVVLGGLYIRKNRGKPREKEGAERAHRAGFGT